MELLRINDRKLKITLTKDDMSAYSLTADTIDYNNTETKRAFWSILDEAKHKTGFDAAKDKIYVQIYPSRGGGCEMYVTKLSDREGRSSPITFSKEPFFFEKTLFRFERLCDLLSACACLSECGFAEESAAFAETNAYYLLLGKQGSEALPQAPRESKAPTPVDLVAEFGKKIDLSYEAFLAEHAECICRNRAVERLSALHTAGHP